MIDTVNEIAAETGASPAAHNAAFARLAQNGGASVDGIPTPPPPRLIQGARVY